MTLLRLLIMRASPATAAHIIPSPLRICTLRPQSLSNLSNHLQRQTLRRAFASGPSGSRSGSRVAAATSKSGASSGASAARTGQPQLPEKLLIYHAGTGRTAFLAFWKITTVFSCAFFCLVAAPNYIRSEDKTFLQAAGMASCGIIPLLFVAYTTAPFVTYVHLRLPPYARQSRALLERFVRNLPSTAQLEIGTMGLATRPRTTLVSAADLRPVPPAAGFRETRFGLVNYVREISALMSKRKWHQYRPVGKFSIRKDATGAGMKKGGVRDAWVWDIVRESLGRRQ